jgi:hypothetical protein
MQSYWMLVSLELLEGPMVEVAIQCPTDGGVGGQTVILYSDDVAAIRDCVDRCMAHRLCDEPETAAATRKTLATVASLGLEQRRPWPSTVRQRRSPRMPQATVFLREKPTTPLVFFATPDAVTLEHPSTHIPADTYWSQLPSVLRGYDLGWFNGCETADAYAATAQECVDEFGDAHTHALREC